MPGVRHAVRELLPPVVGVAERNLIAAQDQQVFRFLSPLNEFVL